MKYLKSYNESLKDYLKSKSDDDILRDLINLPPEEILNKSIKFNFIYGFKYLIDNNLVDKTTKYIIEKYKLGLHQNEMKDYEKWFLKQLNGLNVYRSKYNNFLIYKKGSSVLFNYNEINYIFYYDYDKIYSIFLLKFDINYQLQKILVKGLVEEHLKIRVNTSSFIQR